MYHWLSDLIDLYPSTTRYVVVVLLLAYLVYVLDKVI